MKEFIFPTTGIYYRTNDFRPNRKTLVFVHGLTGSSSAWVKYERLFEDKYNILTFDLRGHGESKKFKYYQDYEIKKFSHDIYDLINYLEIKEFILISHSYGTIIALEFLQEYPNMARAAVFLSPVYNLREMKLSIGFSGIVMNLAGLFSFFPFHPKKGIHIDYSKYPNTGDWSPRRLKADITNTGIRIYLYCLKQLLKSYRKSSWEGLKMPILIVHGKKDTISPVENAIAISSLIDGSKLILLDNANHIIVINNFDEVSEAIDKFVK